MKMDKSCEGVSKSIEEKIKLVESILEQYEIPEKTAGGNLDNIVICCGDEDFLKRIKANTPVVTVLIRNGLDYKKLANELGVKPGGKVYGGEISLGEISFEYNGIRFVTHWLEY